MRKIRFAILCLIPCGVAWPSLAGGSLANPNVLTTDIDPNPPLGPIPSVVIGDSKRVVAKVGGKEITLGMVEQPVLDLFGLQQLLVVAKREYYRQVAEKEGLKITPADEQSARDRLIDQIFAGSISLDEFKGTPDEQKAARKKEMERLLPQLLAKKNVSVEEFDKALFNNAVLWKLAEKETASTITEDHLKQAFGIKYGEKVSVRHIQIPTRVKAMEILQRLKKGERFEDIASAESLDIRSRQFGGEVRAFTRDDPVWKPAFRDAAFSLNVDGEFSDPIDTGEVYEIIQRIKRIDPPIIKYNDVREEIKAELTELVIRNTIETLRDKLDVEAAKLLEISDPAFRERFKRMVDSSPRPRDMENVRDQIKQDNAPANPGSEVAQPPATGPGK